VVTVVKLVVQSL